MNQLLLNSMVEESANILVGFTNERINATLSGTNNYISLYNDTVRVHYLCGALNSVYLVGTTPYIGGSAVTDAYVQEIYQKIWHYNRAFKADLSDYDEIVPDDGEGGAYVPNVTTEDDHYRSANLPVVVGANPVTFIKNGVASPFTSADYTVQAWAISNSSYRQNNVVVTGQTAGGFVANDILEAGTLYYIATLNT